MSEYTDGNERSEVATLHKNTDYDDEDNDDEVGADGIDRDSTDRRDEVGEVRKMSSQDTNRLRFWRIVVMCVLVLTAFAVTFTTYTLLKQQEDENFKTAVRYGT